MAVAEGFYHIEYAEDRYDMLGFQLAAHCSMATDKVGQGARLMVHKPGLCPVAWG